MPERPEGEIRAGRELAHGARDDDLAIARLGQGAGGDVEPDPADVVAAELDLTGVDRGPDVEPDAGQRAPQREGAAQRPGRRVERGEGTVAGRLDASGRASARRRLG